MKHEEPHLPGKTGDATQVDLRERVATRNTEEAKVDCLVLIPPLIRKKVLEPVASIKNQFPPGHRPCCGDSLYTLENFLIQPVSYAIKKTSEECTGKDQDTTVSASGPEAVR